MSPYHERSITKVQKGIVYLVGAGPGDPGLITLKGVRCLRGSASYHLRPLNQPGFT